MHILLEDHPCYIEMDPIVVKDDNGQDRVSPAQNPTRVILKTCAIAPQADLGVQVAVEALLDTGTDVTLVCEERFSELEAQWAFDIPVRKVLFGDNRGEGEQEVSYPAFDLAFLFPGKEAYRSSL